MKLSIKTWSKAKKAFAASVTTVVVAAAAVLSLGFASTTQAASCPGNDIMPCGASSRTSFISKLKNNNPSDMDNIYGDSRYDLPKSQYDEFAKYAKSGKINPNNGNITVDGKTVGYNGLSLGRNSKGSLSSSLKINGKTYYQSHIKDLTKYFNDAMVLFDDKGNVQTVIMNLCGNPIKVTPNNPKYECKALNATKVNDTTYKFSSSVSASNGASVTKVVYDFGDGKTQTEKSPSTVVTHTYTTAGTYTAKVTAYVKTTFGRGEFPITVTANCKKTIIIKEEDKPSVAIDKKVDGVESKQVEVGQNFTYQLKVTNTGNVDLTNVVVKDDAPANVQFISTDRGTIEDNKLVLTLPSLKVAEAVNINIVAKVTTYVPGAIVNNACVDAPAVPGSPDDCDDATVTVPKPKVPSVKIEKLVNGAESDQVEVGEVFTYTVRATNNGEIDLKNVLIRDPAPAGVTLLTTDKGAIAGNVMTYVAPSMNIGESVTISITAKVNEYKPGNIVNTACVNAPEVNPGEPSKDDDCDDATVTVPKPKIPHVKIDKVVNGVERDEVVVGESFVYTLRVTNDGEVNLVNVAVSDSAPAGVTFLSTDKGAIVNNALVYTIPSLNVGASTDIKITARVDVYRPGDIINNACVDAPAVPGNPDDCDGATVTVPKPKVPGVKIDKVVNGVENIEVAVGETFTYTVKATNTGEVDLTNVLISDPAPAHIQFLTTDKGSIEGNKLVYVAPSLKIGESVTIVLTAKVTEQVEGSIKNTACVNAPEVNPANPTVPDDCDDAYVTVKQPGKVQVCDATTGNIIWVLESEANKYEPKDSPKCKTVPVCDPADGIIKDVKWVDKDKYEPVDSPKCSKMQVCVIADGTGAMITISKDQFDASKHSTKSADCRNVKVCRLSDKTIVTVKESAADSSAYSTDMDDCKTVPQVLPNTGAGGVAGLAAGVALLTGIAHRLFIGRKLARELQ